MDPVPRTHALTTDPDAAILNIAPLAVTQLSASDADRESDVLVKKRKRVRTGCFTCRDRHLKCDEAQGQCQNCRKSGRLCRRGVRLNFVDTQVVAPLTYISPPPGSCVTFRDDSRTIASEYVGGFERYPVPDQEPPLEDLARQIPTPVQQSGPGVFFKHTNYPLDRHAAFEDPKEMSLIQVFVNQVGPWMDVVDEMKHFTRVLPFYALDAPLLRATLAACAGCSPSTQISNEPNERLHYYTNATQMLSDYLVSLHRDPSLCAIAALIIEVAEMLVLGPIESGMCIRAGNSARSLIRECNWNTHTQDLSGACSWISIIMELLDCITFRQTIVWEPDSWGVDMSFPVQPSPIIGEEELWTQRIIYVSARVSDFRASSNRQARTSTRTANAQRLQEWTLYAEWCDKWFASVSRSMLPLGRVQPWQRNSQSVFPDIWLLGRSAIVAQMLYHVTRIMLVEMDPFRQDHVAELQEEQQRHAYDVCGIVLSDKNSGIPIFSAQLLAVAAGYLIDRKAQDEVLSILDQMKHTTGLNTNHVKAELQESWGRHSQGHPGFPGTLDTTTGPIDFHTSERGNEYPHIDITDSFAHSLAESHPYLDHHLTLDLT